MILNLPYNIIHVMLYYYYISIVLMLFSDDIFETYTIFIISVIIEDKLNF